MKSVPKHSNGCAIVILVLISFQGVMAKSSARFLTSDASDYVSQHSTFIRKAAPYIIIAGAGGILFAVDGDIRDEFSKPGLHTNTMNDLSRFVAHYGTPAPYLVTAPVAVAYGLIYKDKHSFYVAGEILGALVIQSVISQGVKAAFGRLRPYETRSPYKFFKGGTSFISGHTIDAFTYSTVVAKEYPRQDMSFIGIDRKIPLVPILAYSAGTLVALQRMYSNNHWSSDVYYGALAGYGAGSLAVFLGRKFESGKIHFEWKGTAVVVYSISFN